MSNFFTPNSAIFEKDEGSRHSFGSDSFQASRGQPQISSNFIKFQPPQFNMNQLSGSGQKLHNNSNLSFQNSSHQGMLTSSKEGSNNSFEMQPFYMQPVFPVLQNQMSTPNLPMMSQFHVNNSIEFCDP